MRLLRNGLTLALLASFTTSALASGVGRPNQIGAKAMGFSGAFTAIADDPLAIYHNPAGIAQITGTSIIGDLEFVLGPRTYEPLFGDPLAKPTDCQAGTTNPGCFTQKGHVSTPVIPAVGFSTRIPGANHQPSRVAVGAAFFAPYGGAIAFDVSKTARSPGIEDTLTADFELVPAAAYEVNDVLLLGLGVRIGLSIFNVKAFQQPVTADLSSTGIGIGFNLGALVHVNKMIDVGVTYLSPMNANASGSGTVQLPSGATDVTFTAEQHWPQKAMAGIAIKPSSKLKFSAQIDWTDWSAYQEIVVKLSTGTDFSFAQDFHDAYALHAGAQYEISNKLAVRGGYTFDSNAVPDRTIDRQYTDDDKHLVALGGSYQATSKLGFDLAAELLIPLGPRTVRDNSNDPGHLGRTDLNNVAPGKHEGNLFTIALAATFAF